MRFVLSLFLAFVFVSASAQTAEALQKHRQQYKADLAKDIKADTSQVQFYPFSQAFIITASVEILKNEPVFKMTTSSGMKKEAQKYVKVTFTYNKQSFTLFGYQLTKLKEMKEHANDFFIPFKDATNNKETYAAGRYLDFTLSDIKDGKLVIDFNKAYNPYCAFTDGFNCPIPPAENILPLAVTAGEKKFTGKH